MPSVPSVFDNSNQGNPGRVVGFALDNGYPAAAFGDAGQLVVFDAEGGLRDSSAPQ